MYLGKVESGKEEWSAYAVVECLCILDIPPICHKAFIILHNQLSGTLLNRPTHWWWCLSWSGWIWHHKQQWRPTLYTYVSVRRYYIAHIHARVYLKLQRVQTCDRETDSHHTKICIFFPLCVYMKCIMIVYAHAHAHAHALHVHMHMHSLPPSVSLQVWHLLETI